MSDAVPAPSEGPVIAFFDVDNTLLRGASIFHLGRRAFQKRYITVRDLLVFAWQQARFVAVGENDRHLARIRTRALQLIGGRTEAELADLADEIWERDIQRRLWPETVDLAREHLHKGHEVWLVTASPDAIARVIADRLGLTGALGTRIRSVGGVYTGELDGPVLHGRHKASAAARLVRERSAAAADCWAYSDSRNDIPLLGLVGHRVVVNPDVVLGRHAQLHGWPILTLRPSSIRAAQRRVRREARAVRSGD